MTGRQSLDVEVRASIRSARLWLAGQAGILVGAAWAALETLAGPLAYFWEIVAVGAMSLAGVALILLNTAHRSAPLWDWTVGLFSDRITVAALERLQMPRWLSLIRWPVFVAVVGALVAR